MTAAPPAVLGGETPELAAEAQRPGQWRRLPLKAKAGAVLLGIFVLAGIIGPEVAPTTRPTRTPRPASRCTPPDAAHLLGTTQSGQDVLSQLLIGIRLTLELAIIVGVVATVLAVIVGVSAAFLGGLWDEVLSLASNVFLVIPSLPLLILLLGYLPQKGQTATILVLSVLGWPWGARVIRAQTMAIRNRDFVAAARETGESTWRILAVEIVPNEVSLIAANFVNTVLYAIGASVALAFIGLADLTSWSLGTMLYWAESQQALQLGAWWWFIPPGLAVALMGTALVLLNTGIDELGNPRLRDASHAARSAGGGSGQPTRPRCCTRPRPPAAGSAASRTRSPAAPCSTTATARPAGRPGDREVSDEPRRARARHQGLLGRLPHARRRRPRGEPGEPRAARGRGRRPGRRERLGQVHARLRGVPPAPGTRADHRRQRDLPGAARGRPRRTCSQLGGHELRQLRWREIAIVFQSAMNALNPVLNVRDQITDAIHAHLRMSRHEALDKAASLLDLVGIPRSRLRSYPHELSGGMRQRVMIAMALAADPEIVIMDEPTTALDVVVQRDILAQIVELKAELGFAILFITHDLSLLLELADRIAVMYAGQLMEVAAAAEITREPAHPYTRGLLNSFPSLRGARRELAGIPGTPPDLRHPPPGCPFLPRCGYGTDACQTVDMSLERVASSADLAHLTACPFVLPETPAPEPPAASAEQETRA